MYSEVQIGEVCEVIAGQSPPSSTYNTAGDGLPFYQGKADFGELFPKVRMWCNQPVKIAEPNDILISVRAPVGPTNICTERACIGRGLSAIRAGSDVDYRYLLRFLRRIEQRLSGQGRGSTFSSITQSDLKEIKFPLPPLAEQKRIAAILDKADALRQKRKQSLKLLDEFIRSVFLEMFGDPELDARGHRLEPLGEGAKLQGGYAFKSADYLSSSETRCVRISNVHKDHLTWADVAFLPNSFLEKYKEFRLNCNDLVMAMTRPIIASLSSVKVARVRQRDLPCLLNQRVGRFVVDKRKLDRTYLQYLLYSRYFYRQIDKLCSTSLQPNISSKQIESIVVPVAPLVLQKRFAKVENQMGLTKRTMRESLDKLDNQFNSLVQRAFRGEL